MPEPPPPGPEERRASLRRRFFRLTGFNILANLTVPLAGLVDTAMLGHLADIRFLAGVALATILFDYLYWSLGFLRMGTTGTTAQALGAGQRREVYRVLYRSLVLALGTAAAVLALQVPLRALGFGLLSGTPEVEAAGIAYFNARIWGAPATLANFALVGWFLGREESGRALAVAAAANLANVGFNYLFIVRLGLAAQGAGLATMVSQYLALAVALLLLQRVGRPVPWRNREVFHRRRLGSLVRLNGDILVRSLLLATSFALFTNFSALLGTAVLAANSILMRLFLLAAYLVDGAAFATESLAGIFRGGRDRLALGRLVRLSMASGFAFAGLALAVFFLFQGPILQVLTSHTDVQALARRYQPWLLPVLIFGAAAFIYDGLFLGLTAGRALRNAMLAATGLVFLPLSLLALHTASAHLLWLAFAAFMLARWATLAWASRGLLGQAQA